MFSKKALAVTKNAGLQPAMDWLIEHADDVDEQPGSSSSAEQPPKQDEEEEENLTEPTANSLKCDDCGKLLRNADAAQFHAHKTGHQNFSQSTEEIKPLTEEEKKQKLAELQEKLAARRAERAAAEAAEQKEREKMRRITGREITEVKERQKELEMKKAFEQQRREKEEEKLAKARVKAQIEADKKARAEKAEREKLLRQGQPGPADISGSSAAATAAVPVVSLQGYSEARIQIRLPTGPPLTQSFPADEPLRAVYEFLQSTKGYRMNGFTLSTTFPRFATCIIAI
jgi:hypothetical protein